MKPPANTLLRSNPFGRIVCGALLALCLGLALPVWAAAPFNVNGNGTVSDSSTSLVWDQCPYGLSGSTCATGTAFYGDWASALASATSANAASYKGFTDWRVPNKNELESIAKIDSYSSGVPAIDTAAFPGTPLDGFWTSTTYTPVPSGAWNVNFGTGSADVVNKAGTTYVRLVRSGQTFAAFDGQPTTNLPDTGQTLCDNGSNVMAVCTTANSGDGATYPRQDGRFGRDAKASAGTLVKVGGGAAGFDYSKIANDGSDLGAGVGLTLGTNATDWACTRDNITGLTWEVKVNDVTHLRDKGWTYTWYNSDNATNGGAPGTVSGGSCLATGRCDTEKFVADVNSSALCGFNTGWRLPTQRELFTLAHLGAENPSIDSTYFPNTKNLDYWSATPSAVYSPSGVWTVVFNSGNWGVQGKSIGGWVYVRLVRGTSF